MDEARKLSDAAASVWAKSPPRGALDCLPLWRHLDDSAAVGSELWDRWLPRATRKLIAEALPDREEDGRRLATWLAGVHDIGKATPAFAMQVRQLAERMRDQGLSIPRELPDNDRRLARHATTGQVILERWLGETHHWSRMQARPFAVVVGGHHGVPPTTSDLGQAEDRPSLLGLDDTQQTWRHVHRELLDRSALLHGVDERLPHWREVDLSQPAQVLLTALVIVADWIASNQDLFPYDPERMHDLGRMATAWDELDLPTQWQPVVSSRTPSELFADRFTLPSGASPRPVQAAAVEVARDMPASGLLIVEAPMGEGKTEAALMAAEQLAARCGAGGCFVALPTRATSDAMFARVREWLARVPDADLNAGAFALTLAHGKARFNDDFRSLVKRGYSTAIEQDSPDGGRERITGRRRDLAAHRWLAGRKKAMLSSFVVGTIDQLLFGALKSRHLALRHLGLAGKVVIIDEAHAYDVYMGQYLDRALEWLAAYRVPAIVLSATLPSRRRRELMQAYDRGRGCAPSRPRRPSWRDAAAPLPDPYQHLDGDVGYPALTASGSDGIPVVRAAAASGRAMPIALSQIDDDLDGLTTLLRTDLADGGCALVVRNTVRRAQETAAHLRPPAPVDGSVRVYTRYPLLRSLAVLAPYLRGERALRLPDDIAPLVQAAYGDGSIGPAEWRDTIEAEHERHLELQRRKARKADTFRLAAAGNPGEPIVGWLDAHVGDADDDPRLDGRKQVRDTASESVEVVVVVRRSDGVLVTPPWLTRDGAREVATEHPPAHEVARVVAACTLSLPFELCHIEVIDELEQRNLFDGWQQSPWLQGELALVLDEGGNATVNGRHLHYDPVDGLVVTREGG